MTTGYYCAIFSILWRRKKKKDDQVSKVLPVRTVNGDKEYLLRWKGYVGKADSWVKEED